MSDSKAGDKPLIVVVGATGNQGQSVIDNLLKSGNFRVRGLTRKVDGDASKALKAKGVEMVAADMDKKETLVAAFKGAWGVFAVTNFWEGIFAGRKHDFEYQQGVNQVDAAVENKVNTFVWSGLDDVEKISGGKLKVPHFTWKARVEEYARKSSIPHVIAFYAGWYVQNLAAFGMAKKGADGTIEFAMAHMRPDVQVAAHNVEDTGIYVAAAFADPKKWHGKIIRSGEYLTLGQVAEIFTQVTGKKAKHTRILPYKADEIGEMTEYFNVYGYHNANPTDFCRTTFPGLKGIAGYFYTSGWQGPK